MVSPRVGGAGRGDRVVVDTEVRLDGFLCCTRKRLDIVSTGKAAWNIRKCSSIGAASFLVYVDRI